MVEPVYDILDRVVAKKRPQGINGSTVSTV